MERLEEQVKQKDTDYAELEEQLIKERGDLTSQIEKKNEEVEAVKTKLSKANDELLQIRAKCETLEKSLQEEEKAYDALLGVPRSQSPNRVHVREEVLEADLHTQNIQLALKEETSALHEGRWHRLVEMIRPITGSATSRDGSQDLRHEQLTPQEAYEVVTHFILGASILSESPTHGLLLRGYSGAIHIISKNRSVIFITCPKLQLGAAQANTYWCHVTTDGELVNSPRPTRPTDRGRLQVYVGTCTSTPIPLDPPPPSVTPAPNTPRYWETHSRVGVMSAQIGFPTLEMGVVEESQVDSGRYVYAQRHSWCVIVRSCTTHLGSICTRVWKEGEGGECYSNTMSDTPGTQATLHYGVVLDVGKGRLAFIDLDREVVLAKAKVEFREALLPVFGVGVQILFTVNMKLISGEEIVMTDTKRSLINEALA